MYPFKQFLEHNFESKFSVNKNSMKDIVRQHIVPYALSFKHIYIISSYKTKLAISVVIFESGNIYANDYLVQCYQGRMPGLFLQG